MFHCALVASRLPFFLAILQSSVAFLISSSYLSVALIESVASEETNCNCPNRCPKCKINLVNRYLLRNFLVSNFDFFAHKLHHGGVLFLPIVSKNEQQLCKVVSFRPCVNIHSFSFIMSHHCHYSGNVAMSSSIYAMVFG